MIRACCGAGMSAERASAGRISSAMTATRCVFRAASLPSLLCGFNIISPAMSPAAAAAARPFTLCVRAQERQAKQQVRLPYEHQGAGRQYETGDFRDYLPVPAGGHAGSQHLRDYAAGAASAEAEVTRLGHILYVRDSDEEHDSDEDPDDDLDI